MNALLVLVLFAVAFAAASAAVPPITRIAFRKELLDFPDTGRRGHARPVPRLGGVAVFAGLLAALVLALIANALDLPVGLPAHTPLLIIAVAILFGIGLFDDLKGVPPSLKLLGQAAAAAVVCSDGFAITRVSLPPNHVISLGWLAIPITVVWLVGVSNAFNLVDGLDGLAGGVALIALTMIGIGAVVLGNPTVPTYCVVLGAALLGFLRYNAPPARIFLGDSGSLVVGFLLAYLAAKGATRHDGATLALLPIFALSYPLLDTGLAILRRWLRGDPLSRADGRHIHHQLRALNLSPRLSLLIIFAEAFGVAALGLSVTFAEPQITVAVAAIGGAILLFVLVYGVRWLEYHEFIEAGAILASGIGRMRGAIRETISARDVAQAIMLAPEVERVHEILTDTTDTFNFAHMEVGTPRSSAPKRALAHVGRTAVWKIEYPVLGKDGGPLRNESGEHIVLTIWCGTQARTHAARVERVAQILAPALGEWGQATSTWTVDGHTPVYTPVVQRRGLPGLPTSRSSGPRESGAKAQ